MIPKNPRDNFLNLLRAGRVKQPFARGHERHLTDINKAPKGILFDMDAAELDSAIYNRYIAPVRRAAGKRAGLEFEFPIVNLKIMPVDFGVVHHMADAFTAEFSFSVTGRDDDGFIYAACDEKTGDIMSFDCSYNTLEFSFGTETDLHAVYERFVRYYSFARDELLKCGHTMTGTGINPRRGVNLNIPVASERYRMLYHHLSSYKYYDERERFHPYPNFGMFSCASQIQLDAEEGNLTDILNTFAKLEPYKALIFSNSLWIESDDPADSKFQSRDDLLCARDFLWRESLHGINPRNVDMADFTFESENDIISYIRGMSLYCVERNGKYINFCPMPLSEYFSAESVNGEYFDGEKYQKIRFAPVISDLEYLRSFKFVDLTFRGTVEFRSVCEQPVRDVMAPAAFHAGLMEVLPALKKLLSQDNVIYHKGYSASQLRRIFVKCGWHKDFDKNDVRGQLFKILDLAREGLYLRGNNEETFLLPLYKRAEALTCPAKEMLCGLKAGKTLDYYIEEYGKL